MDPSDNDPVDLRPEGRILLVSCYELGHQPLALALPLGFLERAGYAADAIDIAVEKLDAQKVAKAAFVGISVPMHTALRLGVRVAEHVRQLNPNCRICFYGLYASLNHEHLLGHGADFCIGGEYEQPLVELVRQVESGGRIDVPGVMTRDHARPPLLKRLDFAVPARGKLPALEQYAQLEHEGRRRTAGHVEASRGCLHLCTHCPIPPVYQGRFFALPEEVVIEDIRRQVRAGATHITFGDPDFLNGPTHSLRVARALHSEFPDLTFDFTAKIEHLLKRGEGLAEFAACGCLFIISAVESLSERVLDVLEKHHTRADVEAALRACRAVGIALRPTWVAFTPWTTLDDYVEMLDFIAAEDLIDHVDPVQFSIRLLIPPGSWIADLDATLPHRGELDEAAFTYRWTHPDPRMDQLQRDVARLVEEDTRQAADPARTFYRIWELARGRQVPPTPILPMWGEEGCVFAGDRPRAPRLTETWFC